MTSSDSFRVRESATLLPFLLGTCKDLNRTRLKQLLKHQCILVNDRPATRHDHPLVPGDKVRIQHRKVQPKRAVLPPGLTILYEDDAVIVIHKPTGLVSLPDETNRHGTAFHAVGDYLSGPMGSGRRRPYPVHRIDKPTSGLLLFAKTPRARAFLLDHWKQVEKRYLAIVEGVPTPAAGTLRSHLREGDDKDMRVYSVKEGPGTELAVTHYRVIKPDKHYALVECTLETGRKNQIRVQMAEIGHPIIGDHKYGSRKNPCGRLALHAWRLRFPHPTTRKPVEVESPFPDTLSRILRPD